MNARSGPSDIGARWTFLAALVLALACVPAYAQNTNPNEPQREPFGPEPVINPCVPETVPITGTRTTQFNLIQGGNNNLEFRFRRRDQGEGIGNATLAKYTYSDDFLNVIRFGDKRPAKFETRKDIRAIAHDGKVPSFFFTDRHMIMFGADGQPSVCHAREECRCNRQDAVGVQCGPATECPG